MTPGRYRHVLHARPRKNIWPSSAEDSIRKPRSESPRALKSQSRMVKQAVAGLRFDKLGSATGTPTWSARAAVSVRSRATAITLSGWLDTPLKGLGLDPAKVAKKHDDV